MKKAVLLILMSSMLAGCGASVPYGRTSADPCIPCGESWGFYPNEEYGAHKLAQDMGFYWGINNPEIKNGP